MCGLNHKSSLTGFTLSYECWSRKRERQTNENKMKAFKRKREINYPVYLLMQTLHSTLCRAAVEFANISKPFRTHTHTHTHKEILTPSVIFHSGGSGLFSMVVVFDSAKLYMKVDSATQCFIEFLTCHHIMPPDMTFRSNVCIY